MIIPQVCYNCKHQKTKEKSVGIIVSKNEDQNSRLTERINTDLRIHAQSTSRATDPDFIEEPEYFKDSQKTDQFSWVWFVLVVLALISLIFIILF